MVAVVMPEQAVASEVLAEMLELAAVADPSMFQTAQLASLLMMYLPVVAVAAPVAQVAMVVPP